MTDLLNSTIALTDPTGAIRQRYSYDPYGNVTPSDTTTGFTNPYQYTGREADSPGLYYYRARYYSPMMSGFISEDPITFGGGQLSFYAYVGGNPLSYIDLLGLMSYAQSWSTGGAVAGGAVTAGGSVVVDAFTGGLNIAATPAEIAGGSAIGGGVGYLLGSALDWATDNTQQSTGLPPGYWPADTGAAEWGRRTGVGAREGKGRFHGIKQSCPGSKATDVFGVDPKTGDVVDPTGEVVEPVVMRC
ncbi:RHS repeat-associated core domain-containing protein [Dyella sp. M7H15-1]|uniref:RHS repeat-associated core domain-containing protein n=1 Tax=Dyella sp. M7H15-1 TaxID=2501295 RepID=UPI001F0BB529|nr:RHS repeat-associated core domain-containing protein [Dyella sp. M7H15-1]